MTNSPLHDFLIRIKNGYLAGRLTVTAPTSKVKVALSEVLKKNDFIDGFSVEDRTLTVNLQYDHREPKLTSVSFFSTPGRRVYHRVTSLPWGKTNHSLIIVSTSKGFMSQRQAVKAHLGGEVIAEIY